MSGYFMNTYHRLPVTFELGVGAYLFDTGGKKYLDFGSGIAVNCLGHGHPELIAALRGQSEKLFHVSNYYQSDVSLKFAEKLVKAAQMKNVFFCNSGAEANEGAIKIARKYSLQKYGEGRHNIVTLTGSFHGRTITTLSATGQERFHKNFGPFTEGFISIAPGNIAALDAALDKKTVCAVMIEAIQGESGVNIQDAAFIKAAARFCNERDILLIFDEVQCGMGRTGKFFAYQHYTDDDGNSIAADIATLAKGIAGGVPFGAVLAGPKCADVLQVGDHGSTFGGNPLAAACGIAVLDIVNGQDFLSQITENGRYFMAGLQKIANQKVKSVRGLGLMIAADISEDAGLVLEKCLQEGLLLLSAGEKTLRFLPPYIVTKEQIDEGLQILNKVML
ncbi:MAG: aspartate aminotransferase family protein [Termitinemataceae bacterium]|nr:MAG: aspartate aminotransferase family protein [Termitinemataceae bacterium]